MRESVFGHLAGVQYAARFTRARIIVDQALSLQVRKALRYKCGLLMRMIDVIEAVTGRIHRRAYIEIELADA